jgi:hypothetical protein
MLAPLLEELRRLGDLISRSLDLAADPRPVSMLETARPHIQLAASRFSDLTLGLGFLAAPGTFPEQPRVLEWWYISDGWLERLDPVLDERSELFYDYTQKGFFQVPLRTGGMYIDGPYIDYLGINTYVATVAIPVLAGGEFVGVIGADLSIGLLERHLYPAMPDSRVAQAILVNDKGRVILSNNAEVDAGSLIRDRELVAAVSAGTRPQITLSDGTEVHPCVADAWKLIIVPNREARSA